MRSFNPLVVIRQVKAMSPIKVAWEDEAPLNASFRVRCDKDRMPREALSDHCSLMKHPERTTLPSDCPKDAAYIKTGDQGSDAVLHPITPFPLVIEGGEGNDKVTVVGTPKNPVLIDGGKGNDTVVVQNQPLQDGLNHVVGRMSPEGLIFLAALLIVFATVGALGWRALAKGENSAG